MRKNTIFLMVVVCIQLVFASVALAQNWVSALGSDFKKVYSHGELQFIQNHKTQEKLVVTKSKLVLPFSQMKEFFQQRKLHNEIAINFGFISKFVETQFDENAESFRYNFTVYTYSPYNNSEHVTYQQVHVNKNELVTYEYYPGKTANSAFSVFTKIPQNLWSSVNTNCGESKKSLLSLVIKPAVAAEKCDTAVSLDKQIGSIIDSVRIDCSKAEYQKDGSMSDIKNVISGCFNGVAVGALEFVKLVVEAFDFLVTSAQSMAKTGGVSSVMSSAQIQELKASVGHVAMSANVDTKAATLSMMKMAMASLQEAGEKFRSCGLQYQALQVCQVVGMFIPPGAIAAAAFKGAKTILTKAAAKKAAAIAEEEAKIKAEEKMKLAMKQAAKNKQSQTATATQQEWDDAVKSFNEGQKAKAAADAAREAKRREILNSGPATKDTPDMEFHDDDSELAKEFHRLMEVEKQKAAARAKQLVEEREAAAKLREQMREEDKANRISGKKINLENERATTFADAKARDDFFAQMRRENDKLIRDLGLDKLK